MDPRHELVTQQHKRREIPMAKKSSPNRAQRPNVLQRTQQHRSSSSSVQSRTMEWLEAQLDRPGDPPVEEPDLASKDVSPDPAVKQNPTPSSSEASPLSSSSEKQEPSASQRQGLRGSGVSRPAPVTTRDGEISVGDGTAWKEESQRRVDLWRAAAMKNRAFAEMMEERRRMHIPVDQWRTGYTQNGNTKELG